MGKLLTTEQVCEKLSISRRHLQSLRKRGLFRTIRVSERSLRFDEDEIDAYLHGLSTRTGLLVPPPQLRKVDRHAPDRTPDYAWLDENGARYAGRWVALLDGKLIDSAGTLGDLRVLLAGHDLRRPALVHRVER